MTMSKAHSKIQMTCSQVKKSQQMHSSRGKVNFDTPEPSNSTLSLLTMVNMISAFGMYQVFMLPTSSQNTMRKN